MVNDFNESQIGISEIMMDVHVGPAVKRGVDFIQKQNRPLGKNGTCQFYPGKLPPDRPVPSAERT